VQGATSWCWRPTTAPAAARAPRRRLVCLEDGKRFKSLKRHLRTQYNLSPAQYREKWGLAPDYPMVAPKYAAARSLLAKKIGLGRQRRKKS
jgi:predicted transcriptional regulator